MERKNKYFILNEKNKVYEGFINDLIKQGIEIKLTLKGLRVNAGLNLEELGKLVGVSSSTVSRWEAGILIPDAICIKRLAKVFKISYEDLLNLWEE